MEGENRGRTEPPAAKAGYLSPWQPASVMALASIPRGTVERIIVVGQSTFRPVIVLSLPHFCHSSASLLKLSAPRPAC